MNNTPKTPVILLDSDFDDMSEKDYLDLMPSPRASAEFVWLDGTDEGYFKVIEGPNNDYRHY